MCVGQDIYRPTMALPDQRITLKGWGSGTIAEVGDLVYDGTRSIRISSRNYFQGGTLIFSEPRDLSAVFEDKSSMVVITIQAPELEIATEQGKGKGELSTSKKTRGESLNVGTEAGTKSVEIFIRKVLGMVRAVITTDDGLKSEVYFDLTSSLPDSKGWLTSGVPVAAISGFEKTSKRIQSVTFSGDAVSTFYIGQMVIRKDSTPIYVEPSVRDLNVALGDTVNLYAFGSSGATKTVFEWDFDERDGIDVDAEGIVVARRFLKPGVFTATLTARDFYNIKAPYSTKIKVTVNP